jgi:outer membrane protein assembly factor BamD (BamD/ComL family)
MKLPRTLSFLLVMELAASVSWAQPASPSPFADANAPSAATPGGRYVREAQAVAAQQTGFPGTAAAIYRDLLGDPALPAEARDRITLALVTALMDAGEVAAAEAALRGYVGPRTSAYHLRAGLLAAQAQRLEGAKAALAAGRAEDLPPAERGWWFFLQGAVADMEGAGDRATGFYEQAFNAAVSGAQRARFELAREQARLRAGQVTEAQLATLRGNMERLQGRRQGYTFARAYAAGLDRLGRKAEALAVLQRQLALLPPAERETADLFRLLIGQIAGERSEPGRRLLGEVVRSARNEGNRRLALQMLLRGAQTAGEREQLRALIGDVQDKAPGGIAEDLLLAQAQLALADRNYAEAEAKARDLLERYPGSILRSAAFGVRLAAAWETNRYRAAADLAGQLRQLLPPGRERSELGVLLAEAFFRAADYQNAADAYDAALREAPAVVPAGLLIFQRVLSDIRANRLGEAAEVLDAAAANAGFDTDSRWQAEWNLAKALEAAGQLGTARARVARLLDGDLTGVRPDLQARLRWLQADLAVKDNDPAGALAQADRLLESLAGAAGLDANLARDLASTTLLLKAQALLELGREEEGAALLERLRSEYRGTAAAENSYLAQAERAAQRGDLAAARRLLVELAQTDQEARKSEFAPLALFQAAHYAEQAGAQADLEAANKLLEDLVQRYPGSELVFAARLKQGDVFRKLNDFPNAQLVYEHLLNNFPNHPDRLVAELALGDTLAAMGGPNVVNAGSAMAIYERLRDLPSAPADLRVEAGYKWGFALAQREQTDKAVAVLWSVVADFLLNREEAAKLGATGRTWLARALMRIGELNEAAGRLDEAQRAYELVVEHQLVFVTTAEAKLAKYRAAPETRS